MGGGGGGVRGSKEGVVGEWEGGGIRGSVEGREGGGVRGAITRKRRPYLTGPPDGPLTYDTARVSDSSAAATCTVSDYTRLLVLLGALRETTWWLTSRAAWACATGPTQLGASHHPVLSRPRKMCVAG